MLTRSNPSSIEPVDARFRLVGIDLDGIIQPDLSLHPFDAAAIRTAHASGVKVVLMSAHSPEAIHRYWALLGLGTPVIALNGALVFDYPLHSVLLGRPLAPDHLQRILRTVQNLMPKAAVGLELGGSWVVNRLDRVAKWQIAQTGTWPSAVGSLRPYLETPVYQLWIDGDATDIDQLAPHLADPAASIMRYADPDRLLICSAGASRSWALMSLAAAFNIAPHQILVIGGGQDRAALPAAAFTVTTTAPEEQGGVLSGLSSPVTVARGVAEALEQYIVPITDLVWTEPPAVQAGEEDEWLATEL